jgi:LysR family transcriptional activator of dmlA
VNNEPLVDDLRLFCVAARRASFAATAIETGSSPAYVSKRIAILEKLLRVKLFHRTTRRVAITEDGETVYQWARKILEDVEAMKEAVTNVRTDPRGELRISTSFGLGRNHVAPAISELAKRYPALEVRLELVDRPVDLISEGFDIDIRVGEVHEPNLIAHRIVEGSRILCAAPNYLERRGQPNTLADLAQHACLVIRERDQTFGVWRLQGPNGLETVKVTGPLSSNHGDIVRQWSLAGHGIMLRAVWDVAASLQAGELVNVLPAYRQPAEVWAVSTARLANSAKVRVCVRFLQEQLTRGPLALTTLRDWSRSPVAEEVCEQAVTDPPLQVATDPKRSSR